MNKLHVTPRGAVLEAIQNECDYQDQKWGTLNERNEIMDFVRYMRQELDRMDKYVGPGIGDEHAMAAIRKATTVGVAAMEKFGTGTSRLRE